MQSKKLKREATYEELFIHLHVPSKKQGRKSKRVASEETQDMSELGEGRWGDDTTEEENTTLKIENDEESNDMTGSINIPDPKAKEIYERVKEMECDPEHANTPQELLWLIASGGPSHGRKYGFGCKLDHVLLPNSDTRARPTPSDYSLSASELTEQEGRRMFCAEQVYTMMQEKERQFAE